MLTSEGETLLPVLRESFDRIAETLERFEGGHFREVLTVGAVGTFAVGWLLPRLTDFQAKHPFIDLRLSTNNNRVDVAAEGLDYAIRFGAGAWHGIEAVRLIEAPLSVLCVPEIARQLQTPTTCCSKRCCVPIARMSGPNGFRPPAYRPIQRRPEASSSTRRWR